MVVLISSFQTLHLPLCVVSLATLELNNAFTITQFMQYDRHGLGQLVESETDHQQYLFISYPNTCYLRI